MCILPSRPSALVERCITLIFSQNISTVIRSVHRHQSELSLFTAHHYIGQIEQLFAEGVERRLVAKLPRLPAQAHSVEVVVYSRALNFKDVFVRSCKYCEKLVEQVEKSFMGGVGMADHEKGKKQRVAYPIPS